MELKEKENNSLFTSADDNNVQVVMSAQTKKGGEKSLLGPAKKSYGRSYGSTKKSTQDIFIKHVVARSDTLAGIALKYAVSVSCLISYSMD